VKLRFGQGEVGVGIVSDIESRIAEHFMKSQNGAGQHPVAMTEVDSIISSMGRPEDFGVEDAESKK
jgi:hypothetical protein